MFYLTATFGTQMHDDPVFANAESVNIKLVFETSNAMLLFYKYIEDLHEMVNSHFIPVISQASHTIAELEEL